LTETNISIEIKEHRYNTENQIAPHKTTKNLTPLSHDKITKNLGKKTLMYVKIGGWFKKDVKG
jgi:hypothetical protein